jgi:putative Holliday junction resolvase
MGRVLAVDPGEKRLGVAVSDPTGVIANPLTVLAHIGRSADAAAIARLAREQQAICIVIGQALGGDGEETPQARHAARLAEAVQAMVADVPVVLWDESESTDTAQEARRLMGVRRAKRSGHMDDLAAVVILQSYLDAHASNSNGEVK